MNTITFQCKTITPMFLAGANGKTPELRPPSIKAAMRFWWRAMNGHLSLAELKKKESEIFGGSGEGEGRSKFSLRVLNLHGTPTRAKFPNQTVAATSKGKTFQINILEYLAYGTQEYQKGIGQVFIREYYPVGTKFTIEIKYKDSIKDFPYNEILGLISQVGGLGSRSRNGFGRFVIENNDFDLYEFLKKYSSLPLNDYLVFNKDSKLFKLRNSYSTWDKCLAELGKIYKSSREELEPRHQFNKRQFIASPILDNKRQVTLLDRHTKPYFFVIKKNFNDNTFDGQILFLHYNYLNKFDNPPDSISKLKDEFKTATDEFNKNLGSKLEVKL